MMGEILEFPVHGGKTSSLVALEKGVDFPFEIKRETYHLDSPTRGLHIKNNVWREFTNFSPDCVVMVLASEHYNEMDYIRDYGEFLRSKNGDVS